MTHQRITVSGTSGGVGATTFATLLALHTDADLGAVQAHDRDDIRAMLGMITDPEIDAANPVLPARHQPAASTVNNLGRGSIPASHAIPHIWITTPTYANLRRLVTTLTDTGRDPANTFIVVHEVPGLTLSIDDATNVVGTLGTIVPWAHDPKIARTADAGLIGARTITPDAVRTIADDLTNLAPAQ